MFKITDADAKKRDAKANRGPTLLGTYEREADKAEEGLAAALRHRFIGRGHPEYIGPGDPENFTPKRELPDVTAMTKAEIDALVMAPAPTLRR